MRLGFAGTPRFAEAALEALLNSRHSVAAVFTQPDRPAGRGQTLQCSPIKALAQRHGLPVYQPASLRNAEALGLLRELELDALIVVAYGLILPPAALALPRLGCFNIHASLLPRWRGAAPIQRALLAGDSSTGVTIMRMEAGLDTGPSLAVEVVPIGLDDTAARLTDRLAATGAKLLLSTLDALITGSAQEVPQGETGITYADKINKAEARIDWNDEAVRIERKVRAFNPWPVAATGLNGVQVRIWEAELAPIVAAAGAAADTAAPRALPGTVLAAAAVGIDVACGTGTLRILRLQLAGRKSLTAAEFIQGFVLTGARFVSP